MPLHDLLAAQQRGRELGRLRIGATVTKDGKSRPVKLDAFRFTTPNRRTADAVADLFGGTVEAWEAGSGRAEWEVVTTATDLPVAIPPGEPLTQWNELYSAAGCIRRCDGVTETLSGSACLCPAAGPDRLELAQRGGACKPTSRLSVVLPDLPGLGVWLYRTTGYYAAVELGATADLLHRAAVAGVMLPARLRLEQREIRRPGTPPKRFPVVVLDAEVTVRELMGGTATSALPAAPPRTAPALEAAPPPALDAADAQALADHLLDTRTQADVIALGERAAAAGVLDILVAAPDGTYVELRALLNDRHRSLA